MMNQTNCINCKNMGYCFMYHTVAGAQVQSGILAEFNRVTKAMAETCKMYDEIKGDFTEVKK